MNCKNCGNPYERLGRSARSTPGYCSSRCKNAGGAKLRKERNAAKTERMCYRCGVAKARREFNSATASYCTDCKNAYERAWAKNNPERCAEYKRRSIAKAAASDPDFYRKLTLRKFRMSLGEYERLLADQGGRCAICRIDSPGGRGAWHVDHDRSCCPSAKSCGECVRGLLCTNCNLMLGHAKDEPTVLVAALNYLKADMALLQSELATQWFETHDWFATSARGRFT